MAPPVKTRDRRLRVAAPAVEVSIVMPCLNEAETLAGCIRAAQEAIERLELRAEVLVADNGSTDGSLEIAERLGARVVRVPQRGYGSALAAGIAAARGRFVIMGDSDLSYDFSAIGPFVDRLREGYKLVMGNRFRGRIEPGAMPALHQFFGNPLLSFLGRLFFRSRIGDFYCGLRGFEKAAFERIGLYMTGMEFASEMVVKATLHGLRMTEVPIVLRPDGRSRKPYLRSWHDGWRGLRFMLLFSPRWLFLIPGAAMFGGGAVVSAWLLPGPRRLGPSFGLDIHTLLVASFACLLGYQLIAFALFTKIFAIREGFHPPHRTLFMLFRYVKLETGLLTGAAMTLAGAALLFAAVWGWGAVGFGALNPEVTMRQLIPAVVLLAMGMQTIFASFFISILGIPTGRNLVGGY
jgi:glycosyltransferase involved in cell wall biosynthesis